MFSADKDFEDFLATVPVSVVWREKPELSDAVVWVRGYDLCTDALSSALRSGSVARLEVAWAGVE